VSDRGVTYLGHATLVFERDGTTVLTDPLLRPSLMRLLRRRHDLPPIEPAGIDAILISHAHHDHLDLPTLRRLSRHVPLFVPAGIGGLLEREGFVSVSEVEPGGCGRG
jgi:L-ascorbate metabolism protein UlaG (beta-lactamase superfamily)